MTYLQNRTKINNDKICAEMANVSSHLLSSTVCMSICRNAVPFTATQVEAILSGMQRGLTLVVGPPGTGKTDVAVQIISNLYHNFPDQRTLLVTHSNQALNQVQCTITST